MTDIKFICSNNLGSFKLGDSRDIIINKVRDTFNDKETYVIMESTHNILVKLKHYDRRLVTRRILHFTFNNKHELIHAEFSNIQITGLATIIINNNEIKITKESLEKFIYSTEIVELFCECPIINKEVDSSFKKVCDIDYVSSCIECPHRTQRIISTKNKKNNIYIEYNLDDNRIEISRLDELDNIFKTYGYQEDTINNTIMDNKEIIKCADSNFGLEASDDIIVSELV